MTKQEVCKLLAVINTAYPRFEIKDDSLNATVNLWAVLFNEVPYPVAEKAVQKLIYELKFPPTIADIWQKIEQITNPNRIGSQKELIDLWNEVITVLPKAKEYIEKSITDWQYITEYDPVANACKLIEVRKDGVNHSDLAKEVYDKLSAENKRYFGTYENFSMIALDVDMNEFIKFEKGNYIKLVQPLLERGK